jgi:hypothetical protein
MPCKCGSRTHARTSHHLCPLRRNQGGPALTGDARDFNPLSKWEEHVLVPGLTLWQLNRPTWALVTEDTGDEDKARADIGLAGSAESAGSAKSTGSARSARSAGLGRGGGEGHLHMHLQDGQEVAEPPAASDAGSASGGAGSAGSAYAGGSQEAATISINLRSFSEFKVRRGLL